LLNFINHSFGEIPIFFLNTLAKALSLSIVNIVAVISLLEIAPEALYAHVIWGLLLLQIALFGAGKLSVDQVVKMKLLN
jgi:putative oxidoreductase